MSGSFSASAVMVAKKEKLALVLPSTYWWTDSGPSQLRLQFLYYWTPIRFIEA
jgi:hypothetical protein